MFIRLNRRIMIITACALMLAVLTVTCLGPKAEASTKNSIDKIVNVKTSETSARVDNCLSIVNDTNDTWPTNTWTATCGYFELDLPEGVEWSADSTYFIKKHVSINTTTSIAAITNVPGGLTGNVDVTLTRIDARKLGVQIDFDASGAIKKDEGIKIPLDIVWDRPAPGDIRVTINNNDIVVTGGSYPFAVAGYGGTIAYIDKVANFSGGNASPGSIGIDESISHSVLPGSVITLTLPEKYSWISSGKIALHGGFVGKTVTTACNPSNSRELDISFGGGMPAVARGSLTLTETMIHADSGASTGNVAISIGKSSDTPSGSEITAENLVIARFNADRSIAAITANNILLVGNYAFDLSVPVTTSGYNVNNFIKAAKTAYESGGTNHVYFRAAGNWYDIASDANLATPISGGNVSKINGNGLFQYMNMQ